MTSAVALHSSATCSSDVPAEMTATVPARMPHINIVVRALEITLTSKEL